jgi:hypothetical protein
MEISQDQVHSKQKVWTFTTYPSTNLPQTDYTSVSETFLLADPLWLRKISTDPPILLKSIDCPDNRDPKLKIYISELI